HANTAAKRNSSYDVALDELENCFAVAYSVEEEFDVKEVARIIDDFLATLPRENRILFVRRYWHGESIADLATLFSISSHQVSVRLFRVREKLRKHLIREGVYL
ncbi:MAG: sigma-70 family RNA polymerase sigma factor, partial [Lachnospiraceae bacterium]|nr:sigma-70 family RNA polymerase sigma factor [Lachnospiraceae bacterium]